jgi:hypothetical protein
MTALKQHKSEPEEMSDEELIGYCEWHCQTERALFHSKHITRMLKLAGQEHSGLDEGFYPMWESMEYLCREARKRLPVTSSMHLKE